MATLEANMIKPQLRFVEYHDSWKVVTLSEILDFKNGVNASKEDYGTGFKFINVLDIIDNDFITHDRIKGSVNIPESIFQKNIVEYGDILFQRSSETREEVGQSNVYLDRVNPATFGGFVIRGKQTGDYVPFFLHLALKTPKARKEITSKSGGSTRYNVGQNTLSEVKVILPNIPEQQKIASFLSAVDKRIALLEHKKTKLEEYKKGVMQKIFRQEVRFKPRFEDLNLPPGTVADLAADFPDWKELKLDVIGVTYTGLSGKTKEDFGSGKPYVQYKQIFDRGYVDISKCDLVEITESDNQCKVQYGDVFFTTSSETPDEICTSSVLLNYVDEMYLNSFCFGYRPNSEILKPEFAQFLFRSQNFRRKVIRLAQGSTRYNMSKKAFLKLKIFLPCIEEQDVIAAFLKSIDKKIEMLEQQIEGTNQFKKGLLQQMFV